MSTESTLTGQPVKAKTYALVAGQSFLAGRIKSRRKFLTQSGEALIFTVLNLPAADAFSHPATVELTSRKTLGGVGDDWTGIVRIGGVPNSYKTKPDQDGEIHSVLSARNTFDVVDES